MSGLDYGMLYDPEDARDNCGVGLVVDIGGRRSHSVVEKGLRLIEGMAHRGAENGDGRSGDGAGILLPGRRPAGRGLIPGRMGVPEFFPKAPFAALAEFES